LDFSEKENVDKMIDAWLTDLHTKPPISTKCSCIYVYWPSLLLSQLPAVPCRLTGN